MYFLVSHFLLSEGWLEHTGTLVHYKLHAIPYLLINSFSHTGFKPAKKMWTKKPSINTKMWWKRTMSDTFKLVPILRHPGEKHVKKYRRSLLYSTRFVMFVGKPSATQSGLQISGGIFTWHRIWQWESWSMPPSKRFFHHISTTRSLRYLFCWGFICWICWLLLKTLFFFFLRPQNHHQET